ncbi:hypothetical protein ACOSQ3_021547 [Xanthoceras sorbifolium]
MLQPYNHQLLLERSRLVSLRASRASIITVLQCLLFHEDASLLYLMNQIVNVQNTLCFSSSNNNGISHSMVRSDQMITPNSTDFAALAKSINLNIPVKLDRDNYVYWRAKVLPTIEAFELDYFISDLKPIPTKFVEVVSSNASGKETVVNKEYTSWRKADRLLKCWLFSTISPSLIGGVTDCETSQEVWRSACIHSKNPKKGARTVSDFVLKIKSIGDALKGAGEVVLDKDLLLSILNGIGHEYDPVVVLIANQSQNISIQEAQYMLMVHEQRIAHQNSTSQVDIPIARANFVSNLSGNKQLQRGGFGGGRTNANPRGRGRDRNGGRWNNNNQPPCQICGRSGHSTPFCYNQSNPLNSMHSQVSVNNCKCINFLFITHLLKRINPLNLYIQICWPFPLSIKIYCGFAYQNQHVTLQTEFHSNMCKHQVDQVIRRAF